MNQPDLDHLHKVLPALRQIAADRLALEGDGSMSFALQSVERLLTDNQRLRAVIQTLVPELTIFLTLRAASDHEWAAMERALKRAQALLQEEPV